MRLLAEIVQARFNGRRILYDAWTARQIANADLRGLIPDTWLYVDWPERIIGADKWVQLFRAAGFLTIPYGLSQPASAITVFRGATAERRVGMSWTPDVNRARQFCQRHSWHAPATIYRTVVMPEAVLALLERKGESPPEVVVDPRMLTTIDQLGPSTRTATPKPDDPTFRQWEDAPDRRLHARNAIAGWRREAEQIIRYRYFRSCSRPCKSTWLLHFMEGGLTSRRLDDSPFLQRARKIGRVNYHPIPAPSLMFAPIGMYGDEPSADRSRCT